MSRYVRRAGALGHLLLVVVLALGVFVMHTVGHPDPSPDAGMSSVSHASPMDGPATEDVPAAEDTSLGSSASTHRSLATDPGHSSSAHRPVMAMDMVSLCVAVLFGAWALAALLLMAFTRHREGPTPLLARIGVAPRPGPPPRGPDLTQLSVLRL